MKNSNYCKMIINDKPKMVYKYGGWMFLFNLVMFVSFGGIGLVGLFGFSNESNIMMAIPIIFCLVALPFMLGLLRIIFHWVINILAILFISKKKNVNIDENGYINLNKKR